MLDPPTEFRELAEDYVCVRVTDVQSLDLTRFRFDYDLTLAVLLMNGDGKIYHRFGGRDSRGATTWSSLPALMELMRATLPEHEAYSAPPNSSTASAPSKTVWDLPAFSSRVKRADQKCIHCHTLNEAERDQARADGRFDREQDIFAWPLPARIGIALDPLDQSKISAVIADSPASHAGLRAGDRLRRAGEVGVLTHHDLQYALHETGWGPAVLPIRFERGGSAQSVELALPEGWKRESPRQFAWRASKWDLKPQPGFGGKELEREAKLELGLDLDAFAFRVGYLVTWGRNRASGKNAGRAGIRVGDVVLSLDGKRDFESVGHYHAWFRMTRQPGESVKVRVLRDGQELELQLPVMPRR